MEPLGYIPPAEFEANPQDFDVPMIAALPPQNQD